jgi:uncharacterized membrane protein
MSDTPAWVLSIAYWLHMLATVTWLGGLSAMAFLMLPALRRSLNADNTSVFPNQLQNRLNRLGWISLVVLSATGMFQMSSHPQYQGFLAIENNWATAIFIKHVVISLMVVVSAYLTWGVMPALNRLVLKRAAGKPVDAELAARLERQEQRLMWISLGFAVIVLALTAWARAA